MELEELPPLPISEMFPRRVWDAPQKQSFLSENLNCYMKKNHNNGGKGLNWMKLHSGAFMW